MGPAPKQRRIISQSDLLRNAEFSADPTTVNMPLTVAFTDRSTGYPTSWTGTSVMARHPLHRENPVHVYWTSGEYTVTLTASNEYGSSDTSKAVLHPRHPAIKGEVRC